MRKAISGTQSLKDETAAALKEKYSQEEIREAFEDIQELIDQEELFTADITKTSLWISEAPDGCQGTLPAYRA